MLPFLPIRFVMNRNFQDKEAERIETAVKRVMARLMRKKGWDVHVPRHRIVTGKHNNGS